MNFPARIDKKSHDDPVHICAGCGLKTRFSEQRRYQGRPTFMRRKYCSHKCASEPLQVTYEALYERHVVRTESGCWGWTGPVSTAGYAYLRRNIGDVFGHRFSREKTDGMPIPPGMVVMHSCDNPPCTNPAHLKIGTKKDNTHDMIAKGRHPLMTGGGL